MYIVPVVWYKVAILSCTVVKASVPLLETWTRDAIKVVYLETRQQPLISAEEIYDLPEVVLGCGRTDEREITDRGVDGDETISHR